MDAFEQIISSLLEQQGYWVRSGYKVALTREEKRAIGKPSLPRVEIDILAYGPAASEILWVECKSLMDSRGVRMQHFDPGYRRAPGHYYVFTDPRYRKVVTKRLLHRLRTQKMCAGRLRVVYCLAAGHIASDVDRTQVRELFDQNGWRLYDEIWVRDELARLAGGSYENDIGTMVAKLLIRPMAGNGKSTRTFRERHGSGDR